MNKADPVSFPVRSILKKETGFPLISMSIFRKLTLSKCRKQNHQLLMLKNFQVHRVQTHHFRDKRIIRQGIGERDGIKTRVLLILRSFHKVAPVLKERPPSLQTLSQIMPRHLRLSMLLSSAPKLLRLQFFC